MATHAPITGAPTRAPFTPAPPAAITRILSRFDRDALAGFVAVAIDLLDLADGDPDIEANGDELDGNGAEDDFMHHGRDLLGAAGCRVSDPDCCQAADDIGTDHPAKGKLGFDCALGDDDAEPDDGVGDVLLRQLPRYGLDQSLGPINHVSAGQAHYAAELGLVRSPTGGWRKAH